MAKYGRRPGNQYEIRLRTACGCSKRISIGACEHSSGEHREVISNEPVTEIQRPPDYALSVRVFRRRVYDDVSDIWEFWEEGYEVLTDRVFADAIEDLLAGETLNALLDKRLRPSPNTDLDQWTRWKGNPKA